MTVRVDYPAYDGTTGRGDHGGRRTHIIKLLSDAKEPLTVEQVAKRVELPANAARSYLESLVDAGLAVREPQSRSTPGRPKVAYRGTFPDQAHVRAQGYRFLSEIMAMAIARANPNSSEWMYSVGREWGRCLMKRTGTPDMDESERLDILMDWLDSLWFAPEFHNGDSPRLIFHNCSLCDSACHFPQAVCQLHAGMTNGALEELGSNRRVVRIRVRTPGHKCEAEVSATTQRIPKVPLDIANRAKSPLHP